MQNELMKIDATEAGITTSLADQIERTFSGMVATLRDFDVDFESIVDDAELDIDSVVAKRAKALRNKIVKVRTSADRARKSAKAEYQSAARAVDGAFNIFKHAAEKLEGPLMDIEKYEEVQESLRLDKLRDVRMENLVPLLTDVQYVIIDGYEIAKMSESTWEHCLNGAQSAYDQRIEAERLAAEQQVQEEKEAEELRIHLAEVERKLQKKQRKDADDVKKQLQEAKKMLEERERVSNEERAAEQKIKNEKDAEIVAQQKIIDEQAATERKMKADQLAAERRAEQKKADKMAEEKLAAKKLADADDSEKLASLRKQIEMLSIPDLADELMMDTIKAKVKNLYAYIGGQK